MLPYIAVSLGGNWGGWSRELDLDHDDDDEHDDDDDDNDGDGDDDDDSVVFFNTLTVLRIMTMQCAFWGVGQ